MIYVAEIVYILCALTALACAVLLGRGYRRSRARILLWSTLCFVFLTLNNVLLFLDIVVFLNVDLSLWRDLTSLIAAALLVVGLIWDVE